MTFVLSGLVVFSDKIISDELKNQVKEWVRMTGVGRLFEKEKEEAVKAVIAEKDAEIAKMAAEMAEERAKIKELEAQLALEKAKNSK